MNFLHIYTNHLFLLTGDFSSFFMIYLSLCYERGKIYPMYITNYNLRCTFLKKWLKYELVGLWLWTVTFNKKCRYFVWKACFQDVKAYSIYSICLRNSRLIPGMRFHWSLIRLCLIILKTSTYINIIFN